MRIIKSLLRAGFAPKLAAPMTAIGLGCERSLHYCHFMNSVFRSFSQSVMVMSSKICGPACGIAFFAKTT